MNENETDTKAEKGAPEAPQKEEKEQPQINSTEMIDRANAAAQRLEEANKKQEELIKRQEALQVRQLLGGKAEAGTPQKEETPEEYTKRVMENRTRPKDS